MRLPVTITPAVAAAIGMSVDQAESNTAKASRLAAHKLRELGYTRKYCHAAWNRGQRWFAPASTVPMGDDPAVVILGVALNG